MNVTTTKSSEGGLVEIDRKKVAGFGPFDVVKGIFSSEDVGSATYWVERDDVAVSRRDVFQYAQARTTMPRDALENDAVEPADMADCAIDQVSRAEGFRVLGANFGDEYLVWVVSADDRLRCPPGSRLAASEWLFEALYRRIV
jgi:hypothetical protein